MEQLSSRTREVVKHTREGAACNIYNMGRRSSGIVWANVKALMLHHWHEINLYKLGKDSGIGTGGASRLKDQKSDTRLPTLEKVAKVWGLQPWQLLFPDLDPANPPVALSRDEQALYSRLKRAKAVADGTAQPEPAEAPTGR